MTARCSGPACVASSALIVRFSWWERSRRPPCGNYCAAIVPQILLVDAQIEGALDVCRELRLNGIRPWVILAGADEHERWAVEALKTGVRGILPKSASVENLLKAISVVHQGEVWASNRVIPLIVAELTARLVNPRVGKLAFCERLSPREQEIVHLIVRGLSNLEAATRLGIAEATVKAHLTHIYQKLALRSRAQLAARYHAAFPAPSRGTGGAPPVEHRWTPDPVGARTGREAGP